MPLLDRPLRHLAAGLPLATLLFAAMAGCRGTPSLALPPTQPVAAVRAAASAVEVAPRGLVATLFAVAQPPAGTPVALAAAVISNDRGAPFLGRSSLPIGTLWLGDHDARNLLTWLQTAPGAEAQPLGETTTFVAAGLGATVRVPATPLPEIELRAGGGGIEVQLVTRLEPAVDAAGPVPAELAGHEHLTIAVPLGETDTAALFVPAAAVPGGGYLLALLPGPPPATGLVAEHRPAAPDPADEATATPPAAWQVVMRAIGEHNRRPALLALLGPRQLRRASDAVLAADERALVAITRSLGALPAEQREQPWAMERAVWSGLLPRIERDDLGPAMRAALLRQLGALADDPSTLSLLLDSCADGAAFAAAVHEENTSALEDRSAAARTAAIDWLRSNGVEVPDYDPLAELGARREALQTWRATQAAAEQGAR